MKRVIATGCLLVSFFVAGPSMADILFEVREVGNDVQLTLSGSLNLDATLNPTTPGTGTNENPFFNPMDGLMTSGSAQSDTYLIAGGWTAIFGIGGFDTWDSTLGDRVAMFEDGVTDILGLPTNYTSEASLSGSSTKLNATFLSLGMTPGTYVNTFSNSGVTDTLTIRVVPEPGSLGLLCLGGAFVFRRNRRRPPR